MEHERKQYPLVHMGVVVQDLDAALKSYEAMPGYQLIKRDDGAAPPEEIFTCGVPFRMNMGAIRAAGMELELIQPLNDCHFMDCLRRRGDHIHHACLRVGPELDDVVARLERAGGKVVIAIRGGENRSAFVEMPAGGMVFELLN